MKSKFAVQLWLCNGSYSLSNYVLMNNCLSKSLMHIVSCQSNLIVVTCTVGNCTYAIYKVKSL